MAFYFRLGFGRDLGLSLYLDFGGRGFEFGFCFFFWGGGECFFLNWVMFVGWGWFYFDFLGDYFLSFISLFIFFVCFVLWWNFINICLTFTHSFTQFFFVYCGEVKCWTVYFFFCFWA